MSILPSSLRAPTLLLFTALSLFACCLLNFAAELTASDQIRTAEDSRFSVDLAVGDMPEENEDSVGGTLRVNADFDERNQNKKGHPLADYQPDEEHGHRIVEDDPNLINATFSVRGESAAGRWRLVFPENIKLWMQTSDTTYQELRSSRFSDRVRVPFSCQLKVEGVSGSQASNDVKIIAKFAPEESKVTYGDSVFLTVLETKFALTFDDGPLPEKTEKIVRALNHFYCDGQQVRAGFFQVASKIRKFPELTRFVDRNGHLIFNRALTLERQGQAALNRDKIEEQILLWEKEIFQALGRKPERIIRKRYFKKGSRFEKEVQSLGAGICGGELSFDFRAASVQMVKSKTKEILEGWNTRENPQLRPYPAILIFHEFPEVTYAHIGEIISYLQDQGFILVNFNPELIY